VTAGMTAFDNLDKIVPLRIWDGVIGRAVVGERATLAAIELAPNTVVPEHHHVNEQMGILLRGSLTFRIGDERKTLEPGGTWVIPANVPHDVEVGPDGAWLVELFAPRRDDWGGLDRLEPSPPPF
jgi:quercetin dioxygenase-like cupin family protein